MAFPAEKKGAVDWSAVNSIDCKAVEDQDQDAEDALLVGQPSYCGAAESSVTDSGGLTSCVHNLFTFLFSRAGHVPYADHSRPNGDCGTTTRSQYFIFAISLVLATQSFLRLISVNLAYLLPIYRHGQVHSSDAAAS